MKVLVVGSDSSIGSSLISSLKQRGIEVSGTTRHLENVSGNNFYLELENDPSSWDIPYFFDVAVICAGITKIKTCWRDHEGTSRVNVTGIFALIEKLVDKGVFVVYLSTNQVFDGSTPYPGPHDPVSPITEYGRQKAEVESLIGQWIDRLAVVRFSKILGPNDPLFTSWREDLLNGKIITPFMDMTFSPIPLSFAVFVLRLIIDRCFSGFTHVSGDRDMSYAEAALQGAIVVGADVLLVQPVEARLTSNYSPFPKLTALNINRLKAELGVEPPNVSWTIERMFNDPCQLSADIYN